MSSDCVPQIFDETTSSPSCHSNTALADSNVILLPPKKKKTDKAKTNTLGGKVSREGKRVVAEPQISKSKQRKLKSIQEEKEKKELLAKSISLLETYKLRDDAYGLLQSSGTIGKAQTNREKRLRAAQFSKVGLEMPEDELPSKRKKGAQSDEVGDEDLPSKWSKGHQSDEDLPHNLSPKSSRPMQVAIREDGPSKLERTRENDVNGKQTPTVQSDPKNEMPKEGTSRSDSFLAKSQSTQEHETDASKDEKDVFLVPCCRFEERNDSEDQLQNGGTRIAANGVLTSDTSPEGFAHVPTVIHVSRPEDVVTQRISLPIVMMEQEIMEAINENSVVIICGETGCGKTTQVPQFLYEAGFGSQSSAAKKGIIGITQPRRVAVLATAKRVSYELGLCLGKEVGFQVRHDKMLGEKCSIKFMTDGILMRELQSDFLLKKYSVIILDEAHERSLNTDILIGMLSRIIQTRQKIYLEQRTKLSSGIRVKAEDLISPLRLVLMSATLRVEDFISDRKLFHIPPPVIEVPTRQYPVTIHFAKKTDVVVYVGQAYKKVLQIHKRLPPGGILVFVTGQREIEYLCKKLKNASQQFKSISKEKEILKKSSVAEIDTQIKTEVLELSNSSPEEVEIFDRFEKDQDDPEKDSYSSESDNDNKLADDSDDEDFVTSNLELDSFKESDSLASLKASFDALFGVESKPEHEEKLSTSVPAEENIQKGPGPLCILPLYARLPASAQLRVFDNAHEGERLVVVATNVAETSLTIPGIKYVVDTGREKVKNYNYVNGMEAYEVQWISKASAAQRAGRAGRTGPGHCYRLYSSAAFTNLFSEFSCPQITKIPVDGVTLFMKFLGINKVANFPFPTPPDSKALLEADRCLKALNALDNGGMLTEIGKAMARFPMSPRHSRMLLTILQLMKSQLPSDRANLLLAYGIASAAALSFPNPFNMQIDVQGKSNESGLDRTPDAQQEERKGMKKLRAMAREARSRFRNPSSDALSISYALQLFELAENHVDFCRNNLLHYKAMDEMSKLRKQILHLMFFQSELYPEFSWSHGSIKDVEHVWSSSCVNNPLQMYEEEILGQAICAGWADRVAKQIHRVSNLSETDLKTKAARYQSCAMKETVFLHRWSSVSQTAPEFVVYTELLQSKRPYMHGVTAVKPEWLVKYSSSLCSFSAPLSDPKPYYDPVRDKILCWVSPTFGSHFWQLPLYSIPIKDLLFRVSVFACALLEGNVVPCLKSAQKFLAASPASILRPEASGQKRVGDLLSRLRKGSRIIDCRTALQDTWKENPQALYLELRGWFQAKFQELFESFWHDMHLEMVCPINELYPKKNTMKKKKIQ